MHQRDADRPDDDDLQVGQIGDRDGACQPQPVGQVESPWLCAAPPGQAGRHQDDREDDAGERNWQGRINRGGVLARGDGVPAPQPGRTPAPRRVAAFPAGTRRDGQTGHRGPGPPRARAHSPALGNRGSGSIRALSASTPAEAHDDLAVDRHRRRSRSRRPRARRWSPHRAAACCCPVATHAFQAVTSRPGRRDRGQPGSGEAPRFSPAWFANAQSWKGHAPWSAATGTGGGFNRFVVRGAALLALKGGVVVDDPKCARLRTGSTRAGSTVRVLAADRGSRNQLTPRGSLAPALPSVRPCSASATGVGLVGVARAVVSAFVDHHHQQDQRPDEQDAEAADDGGDQEIGDRPARDWLGLGRGDYPPRLSPRSGAAGGRADRFLVGPRQRRCPRLCWVCCPAAPSLGR